jgi:hypothetical protein
VTQQDGGGLMNQQNGGGLKNDFFFVFDFMAIINEQLTSGQQTLCKDTFLIHA